MQESEKCDYQVDESFGTSPHLEKVREVLGKLIVDFYNLDQPDDLRHFDQFGDFPNARKSRDFIDASKVEYLVKRNHGGYVHPKP